MSPFARRKMMFVAFAATSGFFSLPLHAHADCTELYRAEMNRLTQSMRGSGRGMLDVSVGGGIGAGLMVASGTLIYPPILMSAGAVAVLGGREVDSAFRRKSARHVLHLLLEAESAGEPGEFVQRAAKKMRRRLGKRVDSDQLLAEIREANHTDRFCPRDEFTGLPKLMPFRKVLRVLEGEHGRN